MNIQRRILWAILALALVGALVAGFVLFRRTSGAKDQFTQAMTLGQGFLEKGDATNAVAQYSDAVRLAPEHIDARLNLASACLLAGNSQAVLEHAQQALLLDPNSAAAHYLIGCARMRLNQPEQALQAFQNSQKIDPPVTALDYQIGLAHEQLGHLEDAIRQFETVVQFEPDHPSAHYQLSRLYQRAGRASEAASSLATHRQILAKNPGMSTGIAALEKCKHTQPRVAFVLAQPDAEGVPVRFVEATAQAFGDAAGQYHAPFAVLDYNRDGRNSLWVRQGTVFRLLDNTNGHFSALVQEFPASTNGDYRKVLVGDLNNDRFEDVIVLGEQVSHVFRFATNGQAREVTAAAGLKRLQAREGVLADLDFTGKLDLLSVLPGDQGIRVYRNLGNCYFQDNTATSGLPATIQGVEQVVVEDWNHEDVPGVFFVRKAEIPRFYPKQRAGGFFETNSAASLPQGHAITVADFNNDLRLDLIVAGKTDAQIVFGSMKDRAKLPLNGLQVKQFLAFDYDNDGWQDLIAWGQGVRVWRNRGKAGFQDATSALGLKDAGQIEDVQVADFDGDGDTDFVAASTNGLAFWRNDGGNANHQLKVRLVGNRSNSSGLGVRLEMVAGHWRSIRTRDRMPTEIGVGKTTKLEFLKTHWFDLATTLVDVSVEKDTLSLEELTLPTGSCPYLYTWDGKQFRFVTDILGASPMGLPLSEHRYVEADPEEYLALGNALQFPPKDGAYEIRITEELREVLYLDCVRLVAVDHPADTIVHTTSKMMPGKPFVPHELWTLRPRAKITQATRDDGLDLTSALRAVDLTNAGPARIREPQLRGLSEPWSIELSFDAIPAREPLVLVLNGWLRFGGGMANIGGAIDPNLPFPFPKLEAKLADGAWRPVDVMVGVPAGKTKTILADLTNKLPDGTQRLRLSCAFELYWDAISLAVKAESSLSKIHTLDPTQAELRWHGYGKFEDLPSFLPLTPRYDDVDPVPQWRRTPAGWCTRYGDVLELIRTGDNALALLNGGDEVALSFPAGQLSPIPEGQVRDFFLYAVGWDKDADFHVGQGWRVEPMPYIGMDDQAYGKPGFPSLPTADWQRKYNTRWVDSLVLKTLPAPVKR